MKNFIALLFVAITTLSFGQERTTHSGLNRWVPDNISSGIKFQGNYHIPQYVPDALGATKHSMQGSSYAGGGLGFYLRYDFNKRWAFQPEVFAAFSQSSLSTSRTFEVDSTMTIEKNEIMKTNMLSIEIPLYFKARWELIQIGQGHYKAKSAIGVFLGPRVILTPYSKQNLSREAITTLFDQQSTYRNENAVEGRKGAPFASLGIGAGVDFELWNGFIAYVSYHRGLLTHMRSANGFKAYDNRIEAGIGIRFK